MEISLEDYVFFTFNNQILRNKIYANEKNNTTTFICYKYIFSQCSISLNWKDLCLFLNRVYTNSFIS